MRCPCGSAPFVNLLLGMSPAQVKSTFHSSPRLGISRRKTVELSGDFSPKSMQTRVLVVKIAYISKNGR